VAKPRSQFVEAFEAKRLTCFLEEEWTFFVNDVQPCYGYNRGGASHDRDLRLVPDKISPG
jgi:hypothetical protein